MGGLFTAALGLGLYWLTEPAPRQDLRLPKKDEGSVRRVVAPLSQGPAFHTTFSPGPSSPGASTESWPMFRGPHGDNTRETSVVLASAWPPGGPKLLWSLDVGEGYAGASVLGGRVYLLDYDEKLRRDTLRCLSFQTGGEIWRRSYPLAVKRNHGISRTVCAVGATAVVSMGPKCHVMACDPVTGDLLWFLDLVADQGTQVPLWYTGQCPRIDGETVVLAPGGKDLLLGLDARSGRILWRTPNPGKWQMSHASVTRHIFGGRAAYLYPALGGMVCVTAEGPGAGQTLFASPLWDAPVLAPSAVDLPGNRVLLTAGYGVGSMVLQVDGPSVTSLGRLTKEVFSCEQQTPIRLGSLVFTVMTADAGEHKGELACRDMAPGLGSALWYSGPDDRFGLGPYLLCGDRMLLLDDNGTLTMARVFPKGYKRLARHRVLGGRDAWGPMALVDGRLILRDLKTMICLDLRGPT